MSRSTAPSPKQLSYLKSLAVQTGTTFSFPRTSAEAGREIQRLLALKERGGGFIRVEHETGGQTSLAREANAPEPVYATAPRPGEVSGYGSTASWSKVAADEPPAPSAAQRSYINSLAKQLRVEVETPQTRRDASRQINRLIALRRRRQSSGATPATRPSESRVGDRVELGRYAVDGVERVLYGQRINGSVRLVDRPAAGGGRAYVVERELEQDGFAALKSIVADYVKQAGRLNAVPMASSAIRRELVLSTDSASEPRGLVAA